MKRTRRTARQPRRSNEAGYTLVEMVMVLLILSLLTVAINQTIAETISISNVGEDSMTAIKQVEDALHWLTYDTQQAQSIQPSLNGGFPLKFTWAEWDGTQDTVTYSFNGTELKRHAVISPNTTDTVVARFMVTAASSTKCSVTGSGSFTLPDINDTITITGGQQGSTGHIQLTNGGMTVTHTGTGTYTGTSTAGDWSTPHSGDTIVIKAQYANTVGTWSSSNTAALFGVTADSDGDAVLSGSVMMITLTAAGGDHSSHRETRQGLVFSRS